MLFLQFTMSIQEFCVPVHFALEKLFSVLERVDLILNTV